MERDAHYLAARALIGMEVEKLKLADAITHLLDECRMVLPGIQALFGFQMVAVFSSEFKKLTQNQQELHILAIILVVVAVVLLMAPASLHRQAEPRLASERFLNVGTRLLLTAMVPLCVSICIDVDLVTEIVCHDPAIAAIVSVALLGVFASLWFVYPRIYRARQK